MVRLCSSKIARDMARRMKKIICQKTKICKKKFVKLRYVNFLIKSCSKNMGKALNQSISTFYGLHHEKGNSCTFEPFKKAAHKSRIYRIMKYFDERGHCNRQAGSVWQFEGKNSQSRWIWIEKPQLIHRYVICTILKCILVRK